MTSHPLTITGYSTALFSTWYFIDELALLFDCGDGVCAGLMQKSRRVQQVFVSHADRDHLAGMIQFNQLNSRPGLKIYYPKDCGSFAYLSEFVRRFDPQVSGAEWIPLDDGAEVEIRNDLVVRALENEHVATTGGQIKSLSFLIDEIKRKLKPELVEKSGHEIAQMRKDLGQDAITNTTRSTVFAYSADTPIATDGRWNNVQTLIHEATFLTESEIDPNNPRRNKHSSLDQVLDMVAGSKVQRLVLGHFSSRYDAEQIDSAIRSGCKDRKIGIPVYRLLPGQKVIDILGQPPVVGQAP